MAIVVGVRFKEAGKVYNFDPIGLDFELGEKVVVETARGIECGEVAAEPADVPESEIVKPLKKIIRKATKEDIAKLEENRISAVWLGQRILRCETAPMAITSILLHESLDM
jgi:cell fate regulator YaaT (PSP1 superfamily)